VLIQTPLLVVGSGPAALVVAKIVGRYGVACFLVGHEVTEDETPVPLDADAIAGLERHGMMDILRPYVADQPPTITPRAFEAVIKRHCVADVNVTVYDRMDVVDRVPVGRGIRGVLTDGRAQWELSAVHFVAGSELPCPLQTAITAGATVAESVLAAV
jgi:hypothetical protein